MKTLGLDGWRDIQQICDAAMFEPNDDYSGRAVRQQVIKYLRDNVGMPFIYNGNTIVDIRVIQDPDSRSKRVSFVKE